MRGRSAHDDMDLDFDMDFDDDDVNGDGDTRRNGAAEVDSDDEIPESQDSDGFTTDDATGEYMYY